MPTDQDIVEIATKAGITPERAKQIMQGYGYETLQKDAAFKAESELGYNRNVQDLTIKQQRDSEDLDLQLQQTRENINNQIEDVYKMAQTNMEMVTITGALRGQSMTSGFVL